VTNDAPGTGITLETIVDHLRSVGVDVSVRHPAESLSKSDVPTAIAGATHDSRLVRSGSLFCCVPGDRSDGHNFAQSAVDSGAVALVVQLPIHTTPEVPQIVIDDVRAAMGHVASAAYGHPSKKLVMVGITGTNGKTSTAHMLADILLAAGHHTEVIGTLTQTRTTPEATDLHERLAAFVDQGVTHVVMEVTSHALVLHRVVGIHFAVAVFTNLSQDHLDFHETMEAYFRAKALLFTPEYSSEAVVNADDPRGHLLFDAASIPTTMYSFEQAGSLQAGVTSTFVLRGEPITLHVGGRFSVANALAAAQAAHTLGIADKHIAQGLAGTYVPGRFETIHSGQGFAVIVDYAHTPDGLERVLDSARSITSAGCRLISVFGCGGDRDKTKRPLMGEVSARLSDLSIVTSDNPRSEDAQSIIDEIVIGMAAAQPDSVRVELDRKVAISAAFSEARNGDVVVIAGKGHEVGQEINGVISPFDDRVVAREILATMRGEK
jgi:UDP-N-acetylmuramoyl-L-alanyl-D-glutamate--2,6-diaminopimelate ligase